MEQQDLIGLGVAAVRLGVAYRRAYDLMAVGELRGVRRGARWYVTVASVAEVKRRLLRQSPGVIGRPGTN